VINLKQYTNRTIKGKCKCLFMKSSNILRMVSRGVFLLSLICFYRQQKHDELVPARLGENEQGTMNVVGEDSVSKVFIGLRRLQMRISCCFSEVMKNEKIQIVVRGIEWLDERVTGAIDRYIGGKRTKAVVRGISMLEKFIGDSMDLCMNNRKIQIFKRRLEWSIIWLLSNTVKCLDNKIEMAICGVMRTKDWLSNKFIELSGAKVKMKAACGVKKIQKSVFVWLVRYLGTGTMKNVFFNFMAWCKTTTNSVYRWSNKVNMRHLITNFIEWQTKWTSRLIYHANKVDLSALRPAAEKSLADMAGVVYRYVNRGKMRETIKSVKRVQVAVTKKVENWIERTGIRTVITNIVKLGEGHACTRMIEILQAFRQGAVSKWIIQKITERHIIYIQNENQFKEIRGMGMTIDEELKQKMDSILKKNFEGNADVNNEEVVEEDGKKVLDYGVNHWIGKRTSESTSFTSTVYNTCTLIATKMLVWSIMLGQKWSGNLNRVIRRVEHGSQVEVIHEKKGDGGGCAITTSAQNKKVREELGRGTWRLLHTMASKYPINPEERDKKNIIQFLFLLAKLFPCEECSMHFQKLLNDHAPVVNSRKEFELWLCNAHNIVNKRLGKSNFDCENIGNVWGCGCEI
ncbi:Mitochondrial sulfhydryl oxidase involved in the biogenesis of cytosolic Fe/S proteins, partial [Trachipleistophora hominis]